MQAYRVTFDHINSHGADRIISGEVYVEAESEAQAGASVRQDLARITGNSYEVAVELPGGILGGFGEYRIRLREHPPAQAAPPQAYPVPDLDEPASDGGVANAEQ